jgi:uncharacterized protein (TIGR00661 family)
MKKIIVAPLNWGLGHATRCVPIIKSLQENKFTPVIASDGEALLFLQKEFPGLETILLPSYNITYAKHLKWHLLLQIPKIRKAKNEEKKCIEDYIHKHDDVVGIISDNRFGVRSAKIPSVYVTHQINVLSGWTTFLTSFIHQRVIKKFDECWIPDEEGGRFSGKLSKSKNKLNQKYIGILSRFQKRELEKVHDILILLSGPEPNRTHLENQLKRIYKDSSKRVCLIQGKVEERQKTSTYGNIKVINFMLSDELEEMVSASEKVICRSGYSSIMDLVSLHKKAILIPTKNQTEQEYLAKYLKRLELFEYKEERNLKTCEASMLDTSFEVRYQKSRLPFNLFGLFQGK